jgi:hypothetical protein
MKHSRNLVRLTITSALALIGLLSMPGAGRLNNASASAAPGAPSSSSVAAERFEVKPRLCVGQNADGCLEVFAVATRTVGDKVWHVWQLKPGGSWSAELFEEVNVGLDPVVGRNADGRLEIFGTVTSEPVRRHQLSPGGSWTGWFIL